MSALRKVLVVDDDAVVGKSFNRVLSSKGYVTLLLSRKPKYGLNGKRRIRDPILSIRMPSESSRRLPGILWITPIATSALLPVRMGAPASRNGIRSCGTRGEILFTAPC